jgi:hypothetical protein
MSMHGHERATRRSVNGKEGIVGSSPTEGLGPFAGKKSEGRGSPTMLGPTWAQLTSTERPLRYAASVGRRGEPAGSLVDSAGPASR